MVGVDDNFVEYTYDLSTYAGQNIYLAIQCTQDTYGFVVDDVKVGQPEPNDAGMLSIETPKSFHLVNTDIYPSATIKNYGFSDITGDFNIICEIFDASKALVYTDTVAHSGTLSPDSTDVITFSVVP